MAIQISGTTVIDNNRKFFPTAIHETKITMGANAVDMSIGSVFTKTITTATTFTFSNPPATGTYGAFILELTNGGAFTLTWPTGIKWPGGAASTLTSSGKDILGFYTYDAGTTWSGTLIGKDVR